jgi:putative tryptophan/tyrosine transport system substrate-binding protein
MPVIGFLNSLSQRAFAPETAAFLQGLKSMGFVEGQNLGVEYRWAEGQYDRLPGMADELVRRPVAVLATSGGTVAARAAKAATATIPIVFATADDPVAAGLVASLNRPGGNLTGVSWIGGALRAKNLQLIHELVPAADLVAMLVNPSSPSAEVQSKEVQQAAGPIGTKILILNASTDGEIDAAFATLAQERAGALIVSTDPFLRTRREQLVALAARHAVPTTYFLREFVATGGLMSYGTNLAASFRQAGIYTGRILKGDKPADLPVQQSTRFELAINVKTAKTLGLEVPTTLLATADEAIE